MDTTITVVYSIPVKKDFHQIIDGRKPDLYVLKNKNKMNLVATAKGDQILKA